jgi:hypothetical protein
VIELLAAHGIEVTTDSRGEGIRSAIIPMNAVQGIGAVVEARGMCRDIDCETCINTLAELNADLQTQHQTQHGAAGTGVRSEPVRVSFDERQLLPRWWEKQAYIPNPVRYPHMGSSWDGSRRALVEWAGPTKVLDEHMDDIFYNGVITTEVFDYYREKNLHVAHLTAQALKNFGSSFDEDSLRQLAELHCSSPTPRKGSLCRVCPLPAADATYW